MRLHELTRIKQTLDVVSNYPGLEFAYAVFKNKQIIDKILMDVDFIKNVNPKVIEYEEKRISVCEELADKDSDGNPMTEGDLYIIQDKEKFRNKMDEILEEYRPYVEERQQQVELYNQKMNAEIDVKFMRIKKEDLPPQIQTARDLEQLSFMIE
jgi:hypothetical protein